MSYRKQVLSAKRIIIKFGTNALTRDDGEIALSRIFSFIESIADLKKQGKEIIIITSGAVGFGVKKLGLSEKPTLLAMKQACAAVGQGQLMALYEESFEKYRISTAQLLLTEDSFSNRKKYLSLRRTLNSLIDYGVIPVINENDAISTTELKCYSQDGFKICFSDNDKLSALVMTKLDADLLLILSDVEGLYDDNPNTNKEAKVIPVVKEIDEYIEALGFDASSRGRGGMKTKLEAAKVAMHSGGMAIIANGKNPNIINEVFTGEEVGTLFLPQEDLSGKKRWIAYATSVIGKIKVNNGAKNALVEKNASLLPAGVLEVINEFDVGDVVSIIDENDNEFARGMVNYNSEKSEKIKGHQSCEIESILGYKNYDALITRDNFVIL